MEKMQEKERGRKEMEDYLQSRERTNRRIFPCSDLK